MYAIKHVSCRQGNYFISFPMACVVHGNNRVNYGLDRNPFLLHERQLFLHFLCQGSWSRMGGSWSMRTWTEESVRESDVSFDRSTHSVQSVACIAKKKKNNLKKVQVKRSLQDRSELLVKCLFTSVDALHPPQRHSNKMWCCIKQVHLQLFIWEWRSSPLGMEKCGEKSLIWD